MIRLDRHALFVVALLATFALFALGWWGKANAHQGIGETRATSIWHYLSQPLPAPPDGVASWARLLIVFGDPRVFTLSIVAVALVALLARDRSLACVAIIAPVLADVLTEDVAKPAFGWVRTNAYAYPSGHVTAATGAALVAALLVVRHVPRTRALLYCAVLALSPLVTCFGVVVMHMHDAIDAIGGLAMACAVTCAWACVLPVAVLRSSRT